MGRYEVGESGTGSRAKAGRELSVAFRFAQPGLAHLAVVAELVVQFIGHADPIEQQPGDGALPKLWLLRVQIALAPLLGPGVQGPSGAARMASESGARR
jgi:hypothetical protein